MKPRIMAAVGRKTSLAGITIATEPALSDLISRGRACCLHGGLAGPCKQVAHSTSSQDANAIQGSLHYRQRSLTFSDPDTIHWQPIVSPSWASDSCCFAQNQLKSKLLATISPLAHV